MPSSLHPIYAALSLTDPHPYSLASKDRAHVAKEIKAHAADVSKPPLLVFPEGTCVNNEYIVMFKRGAFELGV